jgi:hypothetical protein
MAAPKLLMTAVPLPLTWPITPTTPAAPASLASTSCSGWMTQSRAITGTRLAAWWRQQQQWQQQAEAAAAVAAAAEAGTQLCVEAGAVGAALQQVAQTATKTVLLVMRSAAGASTRVCMTPSAAALTTSPSSVGSLPRGRCIQGHTAHPQQQLPRLSKRTGTWKPPQAQRLHAQLHGPHTRAQDPPHDHTAAGASQASSSMASGGQPDPMCVPQLCSQPRPRCWPTSCCAHAHGAAKGQAECSERPSTTPWACARIPPAGACRVEDDNAPPTKGPPAMWCNQAMHAKHTSSLLQGLTQSGLTVRSVCLCPSPGPQQTGPAGPVVCLRCPAAHTARRLHTRWPSWRAPPAAGVWWPGWAASPPPRSRLAPGVAGEV